MAANIINMPVTRNVSFRFEYTLKLEQLELEGVRYIGIGVLAKMVDVFGSEIEEYVADITTEPEVAQQLMLLLEEHKVSPMCLKIFVEHFLACV